MKKPEQENALAILAAFLGGELNEIYNQEMGFFICVMPMDCETAVADYVSNAERESGIKWLRETADRLEKRQTIEASQGEH